MNVPEPLNLDPAEKERFEALASAWWDPEGPMKPLHAMNPARVQYIADRCEIRGGRALDVGCGGGILSESLAYRGAQVTGIDLAEKVLKVARLHLLESGLEVHYEALSAEMMAADTDKAFDIITCMELLEHVPDPPSVVKAIGRLLRPGGHGFFSTLNRTPLAFMLGIVGAEYIAGLCPRGTHRYDRFIRPSELSAWIRSAGMVVKDIRGLHYNPVTHSVMLGGHTRVNYLLHAAKPTTSAEADPDPAEQEAA